MSPFKDKVLKKPYTEYNHTFVEPELQNVRLKSVVAIGVGRDAKRAAKEKKCFIFSGKAGIERLLYMDRGFRRVAPYISWNMGPALCKGFQEVLADTPEEHGAIDEADHLFTIPTSYLGWNGH